MVTFANPDYSKIEQLLIQEKYDEVLSIISTIKMQFPNYERLSNGHLANFYTAETLLRRLNSRGIPSNNVLDDIIRFSKNSLKIKPNFAPAHFILGLAYDLQEACIDGYAKLESKEKAIAHLTIAKEIDPRFEPYSNERLNDFLD